MKIALITPLHKEDYLTNTVIDGLMWLRDEGIFHEVRYSSLYETYLPIKEWQMEKTEFIRYAKKADLIIFCWGKNNTDHHTAEQIGEWRRTVYVDGSELGGNRRKDNDIRRQVENFTYRGQGAVDTKMLGSCLAYFRREKPYVKGIVALPFGIERRYLESYSPDVEKDIDVACIFGQEDYPPLRREVRQAVERSDLSVRTKPTRSSLFGRIFGGKSDGRREFYEILARSKAAVSVGGGGFDTARFWEILANDCILLTEKTDIFESADALSRYRRIWQFADREEFESVLKKLEKYLRSGYDRSEMKEEYEMILREHSTKARVETILGTAMKKMRSVS